MGERTSYTPGTFSWVDLQTDDPEGAKAFYSTLFGWQYDDVPVGDGIGYSMAQLDGHSVAALGPLQGEGVPPHWNCYVTVDDADASAARASELGATLLAEPFDVFDAGRMAAFQDHQGAVLSVWQPKESIGAGLVNEPGALSWNDLLSPDVEASAAFYRDMFGWEITEVEGSGGQYWSIVNQGRLNGGMMPLPPGAHPRLEPLLRLRGRRRHDGSRGRARRRDRDGPDRRAQRQPLRDTARPAQRGLQCCGWPDGPVGDGPV
jgi:uncharacterized protein